MPPIVNIGDPEDDVLPGLHASALAILEIGPLPDGATEEQAIEWVKRVENVPGGPPHWDDLAAGDLPRGWPEWMADSARRADGAIGAGVWSVVGDDPITEEG